MSFYFYQVAWVGPQCVHSPQYAATLQDAKEIATDLIRAHLIKDRSEVEITQVAVPNDKKTLLKLINRASPPLQWGRVNGAMWEITDRGGIREVPPEDQ